MIDTPDVPKTVLQSERGRLQAQGKRTDDGSMCTLLVVNEADGSWTFHGLGAPGVKLAEADTVAFAEAVLAACR